MNPEYNDYIPEITISLKRGIEEKIKITGSRSADTLFRKFITEDTIECYEQMVVLFLNRSNESVAWFKISQGGLTGTVVDVRLIFSVALKALATSIILCHNHPSGNVQPSEADRKITRAVRDGG